jgi:hypothetical protein
MQAGLNQHHPGTAREGGGTVIGSWKAAAAGIVAHFMLPMQPWAILENERFMQDHQRNNDLIETELNLDLALYSILPSIKSPFCCDLS